MKFYHGTTEKRWKEIQKEGILWGRKNVKFQGRLLSRINWLAVKKEHAGIYNDKGITDEKCVLLEVEYRLNKYDKLHPDVWQISTYEPIPITNIKRII